MPMLLRRAWHGRGSMQNNPEQAPMETARITDLSRWRALLDLLWRAGRWRVVLFGVLVLVTGLLPTATMLLTGAFIQALPGAVGHGLDTLGGRSALLALSGLVLALVLQALCGKGLAYLCRVLDAALVLEVHHTIAMVTLGTPGVAPLEDPAFADQLQAIQDAHKRGALSRPITELSNVLSMRLRGIGAFVVLLGFRWWAPLLLTAVWQLTNLVYLKTTERGVTAQMTNGAVRQRRAEYLRTVALDASTAKEIRIFGLGGWAVRQYADTWLEALEIMWRDRRAHRGLNAAVTLAMLLAHAVVLGALGLAASRGETTVAALFVFVQAVLATSDLGLVGDSQWWLSQGLAVAERVVKLRSLAPAQLPSGKSKGASASQGNAVAVHLDNVRFTYRGREQPTLDGLTLTVPPGQSLAIVGENGAGKSTLIKLLCGLYEPDGGRVTLDGAASPLEARGRVGVIFQDFVRYRLPLRENVGFGHLPVLDDDVVLEGALRDAGGAELLDRMPKGWETVLSREFEGGVDLSGGQWQRIALARALTAIRGGAGLLILDEPTASLDVRAETELFERFLELTRNVTTILVSHRLSSVRHADRIVVIHGGRVVEDGTHDELMRAGGRYAQMFLLQAERFTEAQYAGNEMGEEVGHG